MDRQGDPIRSRQMIASVVFVLLLAGMVAGGWWVKNQFTSKSMVERVSGLAKALHVSPEVLLRQSSMSESSQSTAEVVTASQRLIQNMDYQVKWLGSKKELEVCGEFTVKVGFLVGKNLEFRVEDGGKCLVLEYGKPEVLSCELVSVKILREEDGYWNRLDRTDRDACFNQLLRMARERAQQSDWLDCAEKSLLEKLRETDGQNGIRIQGTRKAW